MGKGCHVGFLSFLFENPTKKSHSKYQSYVSPYFWIDNNFHKNWDFFRKFSTTAKVDGVMGLMCLSFKKMRGAKRRQRRKYWFAAGIFPKGWIVATELCTVGKNSTFSFHSNHILQINVYTRITLPKLEVFKLWKIE